MRSDGANFILFSDVHLGADLVQHIRPWTLSRLKQVARIDRDLAAMLDHYREHSDPLRPWRLVIAGDLVDFIGMSIAPHPGSPLDVGLTSEERSFGLGSTGEHAAAKMLAVADRHGLVFERLAAFLMAGHSLVLVRGNHDVDFHWETARRAFLDALLSRLGDAGDEPGARAALEARVEFHPWFYYEEGLLYVEHGHQFDAMCSYHHLLAPVSPLDPKRISWSFSDILLRTVVRPTRGLGADGHDALGVGDYVRLGLSLGIGGGARLGYRFLAAITKALRRSRAHLSAAANLLRLEHERGMEEMAGRLRLRVEQLRAVAGLWPEPITRGFLGVLRSMFIDRILMGFITALAIVVLGIFLPIEWGLASAGGLLLVTALYFVWSGRRRFHEIDPSETMRRAAARIAELLPTRFVVMGHTHEPILTTVSDRATYVNLGNWGVDDTEVSEEAPRTHLVIRFVDGVPRAEFLRWVPGQGPLPHRLGGLLRGGSEGRSEGP